MKTIEEAALNYAARKVILNEFCPAQDFIAGVEFAQRWIDVKDELPTEQGRFLLKHRKYGVHSGTLMDLVGEFKIGEVTHWRPIELK